MRTLIMTFLILIVSIPVLPFLGMIVSYLSIFGLLTFPIFLYIHEIFLFFKRNKKTE